MSEFQGSHRIGFAALVSPGVLLVAVALLSDVARGGQFAAGWGTGQSILLVIGLILIGLGVLIHTKARQAERSGKRRYQRTIAFILAPMLVLIVLPLCAAEVVCRWLPQPDDTSASYRQTDPRFGFSVAPNRAYHVVSRAKEFDIHIRIDDQGFRIGADGKPVALSDAEIVIMGDSHPFGFGAPENETLSHHLAMTLEGTSDGAPQILNAGIPGFGLGQTLLLMKSLNDFPSGGVVVVFVNPLNDLVNTCSAVDYHYPKPHAVLSNGNLTFGSAPSWGEGPFLFSPGFASLNEVFKLSDQRKFYESALWRRMNFAASQPKIVDGVTQLIDETESHQYQLDDDSRIRNDPLLYASRYWPEMPRFESERQSLSELTTAVFQSMADVATKSDWKLLVVVAPESHIHQEYGRQFVDKIRTELPSETIKPGWSHAAVIDALQKAQVDHIIPDYETLAAQENLDLESFFVPNDGHTSGTGHRVIADIVARRIQDHGNQQ